MVELFSPLSMKHFSLILLFFGFGIFPSISQVSFQSSNLPLVIIDTDGQEIPDEPKIGAYMGIVFNGDGIRNSISDPHNNYSGAIGIELRGSSSQFYSDKKPYAFETRNADGSNLNVELLGMPSENDWILLAPYSDKSLMRDVLTYKLASGMMAWAPRCRFVELVVNGSYFGVFVLMESIKRDDDRVDIAKLDPDENTGDDLTGGYILKIDKTTGSNNDGFYSQYHPYENPWANIQYLYHYPKPDLISNQQKNYIKQYIDNFENVMASDNFNDPVNGYPAVIDVPSFVDFFIINELTRNVDGYRISTFMYKDKDSNGGKLVMGPVWDFNIAFGNADYCEGGVIQGWASDFNLVCSGDNNLIPFWWKKFRQDTLFKANVRARWELLRQGQLHKDTIFSMIDSMRTFLDEAQTRNFQKWDILGQYVWPNNYVGLTYQDEINYLKNWINARLLWLDNQIDGFPVLSTSVRSPEIINVHAYPNPVSKGSIVRWEGSIVESGIYTLKVFDVLGKDIYEQKINQGRSLGSFSWEAQTTGVFIYVIASEDNTIARGKIIVE